MLRMTFASRVALALGLARADDTGGDPSAWTADVTPPARSAAGTGVSLTEALTLDAVYRAFFVLQTAVSQLTLDVWRRQMPLSVTPSLVAQPDVNDDQSGWLADTTASLAARGNAYWLNHFGPDKSVISLPVLDPLQVTPFLDDNGRKRFAYDGKTWTPSQITHLRLMRVPGHPVGLGPIQAASRRLAGARDVAEYGDNYFQKSGVPSGTLNTEQALTAEQAKAWKQQWHDQVRTGETAVLGSGLSYSKIYLTPREAQWIESQRWSVTSIARLFGIPPRLLIAALDGDSMTYANAETEDRQFVKYTLAAYLRPIEQALTGVLPRGQSVRFNLDGFLRADTTARYAAHKTGLDAGFLTVPEVRRIEGLPQLAADELPTPAPAPSVPDPEDATQ